MNQYVKDINFAMRLHMTLPERMTLFEDLPNGWEVILGQGALQSFYVSEVDNPPPEVRSDAVTVAGMNGSIYTAEDAGRVLFEDKTVTVKFGGRGDDMNWNLVGVLRSNYQGRLVDFTFEDYRNVKHFQTGRVSVDFDPILCTFEMVFTEVPPFLYSTELFQKVVTARTNYELANNSDAWVFDEDFYGTPPYHSDSPMDFVYSVGENGFEIGSDYIRKKGVGGAIGSKLLFGVKSIVGGEVWFEDADGNKSKTYATVCPTTMTGQTGEIRMHFRVDGSYYQWVNTQLEYATRAYLPTLRCQYVLSNYVNIDSDGNIINVSGDGITTHTFPSNVAIAPDVNATNCIIIFDGIATEFNASRTFVVKVPRLVLPNANAEKIGTDSKSVFCCVPKTNAAATSVSAGFRFIPCEVF